MAEDKKPLGQKGIGDLIALMEANNKSTKKIEVDKKYPTLKIVIPYKTISTTNKIVFL